MILNKKLFLNYKPQIFIAGDFETITTKSKAFKNPKYYDSQTNTFKFPITAFCLTEFNPFNNNTQNPDFHILGTSVSQMFEEIKVNYINTQLTIFFHNFKAFDGFIILDYIRHHFVLIDQVDFNIPEKFKNFIENLPPFTPLYNYELKDNQFLLMDIFLPQTNTSIRFQCSLRLLTLSIAQLGKALNFPKQTTDYDVEPEDDINNYPKQYIEYLKTDTIILAKALIQFFQQVQQINKHFKTNIWPLALTAGALTRSFVKELDEDDIFHKIKKEKNEIAQNYFFGGFTALNNNYLDKPATEPLVIFDAKSFYPSIMALYDLPTNDVSIKDLDNPIPVFNILNKLYDNYFITLNFPTTPTPLTGWAPLRDNSPSDLTYRHTVKPNQLTHWSGTVKEFKAIIPFYNFPSSPLITQIVAINSTHQKLKPYIEQLYHFKETSTTPLTFKILLNSTYGSLALTDFNDFSVVLNHQDQATLKTQEDRKQFFNTMFKIWEIKQNELKKSYFSPKAQGTKFQPFQFSNNTTMKFEKYLTKTKTKKNHKTKEKTKEIEFHRHQRAKWWNKWIPALITSYCRALLFDLIAVEPNDVIYCDTDSMFIKANSKIITHLQQHNLIGKNLGQWEQEEHPPIHSFHFLAPKAYTLFDKDKKPIKLGMKGVDKETVYNLLNENPEHFETLTLIPDGQKCSIIKIHPNNFDNDGKILKPPKNQKYQPADYYYPFIIRADKKLIKVDKIRKEVQNDKK